MRAVVTGGAGFIGSHLCDRILENKSDSVVILDSLRTGKISNINSSAVFKCCNLTRIPEDVHSIDVVFHLAAQTSVQESIKDPVRTIDVNVLRTTNLLSWAVKHNIENFVYVSSAAVYGDTKDMPITEETPVNPLSPYGMSKYMGELVCEYYADTYGMNVAVLRPFNVYGPRQDPNSEYAAVIPKFMERISKGQQPMIYGNGEQTRDFVYVSDVIDAALLSIGSTGVFNIGTGHGTSVNELARIIASIGGMECKPIYKSARMGDIIHSVSSPRLAERCFGFKPKISLSDGLKRMWVSDQ